MIKAELTDAERARQNRELVKAGLGNRFYDRQARIAAQWKEGDPLPKSLVVAEHNPSPVPQAYPFAGGKRNEDEY